MDHDRKRGKEGGQRDRGRSSGCCYGDAEWTGEETEEFMENSPGKEDDNTSRPMRALHQLPGKFKQT